MAINGRYILVAFVENQEIGFSFPRRRNDWPYHITLVPWFDADKTELQPRLQRVVDDCRPYDATVSMATNFGSNAEIPVNLVAAPANFRALHERLLEAVAEAGGSGYDERWLRGAYQPHVTRHFDGAEGYDPGFTFEVPGFSVVRLEPNNTCTIDSYYPFGKAV